MLLYAILTFVALIFDITVIFAGVANMNNDVGVYSTVFLFLLGVLYFVIALFFIIWAISVK